MNAPDSAAALHPENSAGNNPGLVAWDARASLVDLTIAGPIGIIVVVSSVAQLAIYGRLLVVGLSKPSAAVVAGLSERPAWPDIVEGRRVVGLSRAERAFERGGHAMDAASIPQPHSRSKSIRSSRASQTPG